MRKNKTILAAVLGAMLASNVYAADNIAPQLAVKNDNISEKKSLDNSGVINNNILSEVALKNKKLERWKTRKK